MPVATGSPPWSPFVIVVPPLLSAILPPGFRLPTLPGTPPPATPPPATPPPATPPPATPPPSPSTDRVIVFGTSWCPACKQLRADLAARRVPYTYVDVEDRVAMSTPAGRRAAEIPPAHRGGVPVTRIVRSDGSVDWVSGADGERIEKAYRS